MKKKVLYIHPLHPSGMDFLRERYDVTVDDDESKEHLLSVIGDYHAVTTRLTVIDADIIAAGKNLKAIAKHGVGVDNIDVSAATERGIAVLTTGTANSVSVAEHAFFAAGALAKRIVHLDDAMRHGNWASRDEKGSIDLNGRTLGLVGMGRIGSAMAFMAKNGFSMPVIVYDPFLTKEAVEREGYLWTDDVDDLCARADVLSLHVPLTDGTRNLIDARRLAMMKPTAIVLNFARGGVVNEDDLYVALRDKTIAAAAIDAWEHEPPDFKHPLFQLDNVLLSPHCGTFTEDSRKRMSMAVAEGIDAVLSGRVPVNAANKLELYGEE